MNVKSYICITVSIVLFCFATVPVLAAEAHLIEWQKVFRKSDCFPDFRVRLINSIKWDNILKKNLNNKENTS